MGNSFRRNSCAAEIADSALSRNSTSDYAERERRITQENHGAENERFLAARQDDMAQWFTDGGGQPVNPETLRVAFGEKVRTVSPRTGDLAAAQRMALADLRREGVPEA